MIGAVTPGNDLAFLSPVAVADGPVGHDFVAGLHAAAAQDAAAEVPNDERIFVLRRVLLLFAAEPRLGDFVEIGQVLQAAVAVCLAHEAVVSAAGQQQFDVQLARAVDSFRLREDFHAGADRRGTGGDQRTGAADLDQADPAGASGGRVLQVTECGNVDAAVAGCDQNRLSRLEEGLFSVQDECCAAHDSSMMHYVETNICYVKYDIYLACFIQSRRS